jgi:hypothetical protein
MVPPPVVGAYVLLEAADRLTSAIAAAHFVVVYIATAVACQLGLGEAGASARTTLLTALAIVTVAADSIVVVHALGRYWPGLEAPGQRF